MGGERQKEEGAIHSLSDAFLSVTEQPLSDNAAKKIWFGNGEFVCTVHRGMLQDRTVVWFQFEEKDGGIKVKVAALSSHKTTTVSVKRQSLKWKKFQ